MSNLSTTTESQPTPGQMIKAAREAKQISLSEVAQNLLLGKQTIMALEADDYSNVSAEVYAEGYLKAYAKFLQISVEEVLSGFQRLNVYPAVEAKPEVKSKNSHDVTWTLRDQRVLFGLLVFLILAVLALVIAKRVGKNSEVISATATPQAQVSSSGSTNDSSAVVDKEQLSVTTTSNVAESASDQSSTTDDN